MRKTCNFEKLETLIKRITTNIDDPTNGELRSCNICYKYATRLRKFTKRRSCTQIGKTGALHFPYYRKENTNIGNLKMHISGIVGRKGKDVLENTMDEVWRNVSTENRRTD